MTDDLISRQAVIEKLNELDWQDLYLPIHFKEFILDELPTVQPKTGQWFGTVCSACGESYPYNYDAKYCPNCGAKMEGGTE